MRRVALTLTLVAVILAVSSPRKHPDSIQEESARLDAAASNARRQSRTDTVHRLEYSALPSEPDGTSAPNSTTLTEDGIRDEEGSFDLQQIPVGEIPVWLNRMLSKDGTVLTERSSQLVARWAEVSPREALQWANRLTQGQGREEAVRQTVLIWADSDLMGAIEFAKAEPAGDLKVRLTLGLGYESLREDPRVGLELVSNLPADEQRDEFLVQGVGEWASRDATQVVDWVKQIGDPRLRERLLAAAALGMAEQNGLAAATLVASSVHSIEDRDRTTVAILQRWIQSSPSDATAWLDQFPDTPLKKAATESAIPIWVAADPVSSRRWVESLPQGQLKDWAGAALAR